MYIRIENDNFGFIDPNIAEVRRSDIEISKSDYLEFLRLQSQCKQFRVKNANGNSLFEIIEEYKNESSNQNSIGCRVDSLEVENADLMFTLMVNGVI